MKAPPLCPHCKVRARLPRKSEIGDYGPWRALCAPCNKAKLVKYRKEHGNNGAPTDEELHEMANKYRPTS